jgi:hypothetical protein
LEHAATNLVTEKLSAFLGDPDSCPHGEFIPPAQRWFEDICLSKVPLGSTVKITRISPETPDLLRRVQDWDLMPGNLVTVLEHDKDYTRVTVENDPIKVTTKDAQRIWAEVM